MPKTARAIRPLFWIASSQRDYREFPPPVQDSLGFELFLVQIGQHPPSAKPLKGLGSGTVELVEDFDGDTYRAVYTVRFKRPFMSCTPSRRSRSAAPRRPSATLILL
jgi:phage-related protein